MTTTGPTTPGTTTASGSSSPTDVAKETATAAKDGAVEVAKEATSVASDVAQTAKSEVGSVVSDATQRAGEVLRATQDELRTQAAERAKSISSTLDELASQLTSMANGADDPDSTVAQLARSAADQLRSQGGRLEDGGFEGLIDDARRLARNRPGVFMLGTVAAGFLAGRLHKHADLKQTAERARSELTGGSQNGSDSGSPTGSVGSTSVGSTSPTVGAMPPVGGPAAGGVGGATATGSSVFDAPHPGRADGAL